MPSDTTIRETLARALSWSDARVSLEEAVRGLPAELRGTRPEGLPHSPWELLEHVRIAQRDLLDFATAASYVEQEWPADYWPPAPAPPDPAAWERSLAQLREDRERLQALARDAAVDLAAVTPHGTDQTYLRTLLLALDHTAYHVGQLVLVRQLLGAWPPPVNPGPFVVTHPCPACGGDGRREGEPCAACHATGVGRFLHGTKADLRPGDRVEPGRAANFGRLDRETTFVYFTGTLDAAVWGAELARGEGRGRIYVVEPTGPIEDDPNLTDQRFPGNPTRSFRSREALRVTGEVEGWPGHPPAQLKAMKDELARLAAEGVEPSD